MTLMLLSSHMPWRPKPSCACRGDSSCLAAFFPALEGLPAPVLTALRAAQACLLKGLFC